MISVSGVGMEYRGRGFPDSSYQFNLAYRYLEDYLDEAK